MRVPVPEDIQKAAQKYARYLAQRISPKVGFAIFFAPFGEDPKDDWVFYISNTDREGMMKIVSNYLSMEGH